MSKPPKISAIIAAGGNASRLGIPGINSKQFVLLNGKTMMLYSLKKLTTIECITEIIISTNDIGRTKSIIEKTFFSKMDINIKFAESGLLRQDSVYNAFLCVDPSSDFVLIHDVARPLFKIELVQKCIDEALKTKAAILAVPLSDTIKSARSNTDKLTVVRTLDRKELYLVQTPQVISYNLLARAYDFLWNNKNKSTPVFTDEASMLEFLGEAVTLVLSDRINIKVTYPEDITIANAILQSEEKAASCNV
jgi:2-C-methyl-D-erythritol 4-phosphate cytidylyltransferase